MMNKSLHHNLIFQGPSAVLIGSLLQTVVMPMYMLSDWLKRMDGPDLGRKRLANIFRNPGWYPSLRLFNTHTKQIPTDVVV